MNSNSYNKYYGITTFGESHGKAIGVVIEDVKPGIEFPLEKIQSALNKRRPGKGAFSSPRNEPDELQVISGSFRWENHRYADLFIGLQRRPSQPGL